MRQVSFSIMDSDGDRFEIYRSTESTDLIYVSCKSGDSQMEIPVALTLKNARALRSFLAMLTDHYEEETWNEEGDSDE